MRTSLILVSLLTLLVSCSGKSPSKANFNVEVTGMPLASAFGGLVIYGSSGIHKFTRVVATSGSGSITEELPKGPWKFGAFAWTGPNAFQGEVRCAFIDTVLDQDVQSVNLSLSNVRCTGADVVVPGSFSAATPHTFKPLKSSVCEQQVSGRTNTPCNYDPLLPGTSGFIGSYRLVVRDPVTPLVSNCYLAGEDADPDTGNTTFEDGLNIPAFLPTVKAPILIEAYLSADCDATLSSKGLLVRSVSDPAEAKFHIYDSDADAVADNVLIHIAAPTATLCQLSDTLGTTSFASGAGVPLAPWLICNEQQLLHLQENMGNSTYAQASYVLGRDLNLMTFVKGPTGSTPSNSCLDYGDTLVPLGKHLDPLSSCAVSNYSVSLQFDGNNKRISHFRFRSPDDNTGFFSNLSGKVYNLHFDNAEIEGENYAGVVAGYMTGATLNNVVVKNSRVRGGDYIGGIAGYHQGTGTLQNLFVSKTEIEAEQYVGGVIGQVNTSSLSKASFDGKIYADSGNMYIGGIVGMIGTISQVVSTGLIESGSTYLGGIAGVAFNVSFARSDMVIKDYNPSASGDRLIGGIAGSLSGSIDRSFYRGLILTKCNTAGNCHVGNLTGNPASANSSFSTSTFAVDGTPGDGTTYNYTAMTTSTAFRSSLCSGAALPCPWTQVSEDIPRLAFESHLCSVPANNKTIADQVAAGRGTSASNPIYICRQHGIGDLGTTPASGKYFKLAQNINLGSQVMTNVVFNGHFDGDGNYLFGFKTSENNTDSNLFNEIALGSTFKNAKLAGFEHIQNASCPSCVKAGLVGLNNGTISQVELSALHVDANDSTAKVAGVAGVNTGTISRVKVNGELFNLSTIGGIAYENNNLIEKSMVDVRIDTKGSTVAMNVGGVAGLSSGIVRENSFRGSISGFGAGGYFIGGIVGDLINSGTPPQVIDNHVGYQATLEFSTGITSSGGIVGNSDSALNLVARNIFSGLLLNESGDNTSIKPIVGDGSHTETIGSDINGNFKENTDYTYVDSLISSFGTFSGSPLPDGICQMDITTDSLVDASLNNVEGALKFSSDKAYFGTIVHESSTNYKFYARMDSSMCAYWNGLSAGGVSLNKALSAPDTFTITDLRNNKFIVYDFGDPVDVNYILDAYLEIMLGNIPQNYPTWTYEEEDGGYRLFDSH